MPANPIAYFLTKFPQSQMIESKNCFIGFLPSAPDTKITLQGVTHHLTDHHLTIYKNYNKNGPIHYTATFHHLVIHVYFDGGGNYLSFNVRPLKGPLSENEKARVEQFAKKHAGDSLSGLLKDLEAKQKGSADEKKAKLSELTRASRQSTTDERYRTLLQDTLQALREYENLEFHLDDEDRGAITFLNNYWQYLQKNPTKTRVPRVLPELKDESNVIDHEEEKTSVASPLPGVAKQKTPNVNQKSTDDLSATLKQRERELDEKLGECPRDDLNQALSIIKQMDSVKKLTIKLLLFQLCLEGNVDAFKRHFSAAKLNEMENLQISRLLSTCVYHNHQELFHYLYKQIKNYFVKHGLYNTPLVSLNPVSYFGSCCSLLEVAYKRRNLVFYKLLLTEYSYNPNNINMYYNSLIATIMDDETEFALALLRNGVDPNMSISNQELIEFVPKDLEKKDSLDMLTGDNVTISPKKELQENREDTLGKLAGRKPLHIAVQKNNLEVVRELFERNADSYAKEDSGITPFGYALLEGVDLEIIRLFLAKGHHIDEKQSTNPTSGLFNACAAKKLELVKKLLEFKADPCLVHENILTDTGQCVKYQSPLFTALSDKNLPIITEILKCQIKLADLKFIYNHCKEKCVPVPDIYIQKYAVEAHKAGELKLAEGLYKELIFITNNRELKHVAFFNLATCVEARGRKEEARVYLNVCIGIREELAKDPVKKERMQPLIEKAKARLALINEYVPEQKHEFDRRRVNA